MCKRFRRSNLEKNTKILFVKGEGNKKYYDNKNNRNIIDFFLFVTYNTSRLKILLKARAGMFVILLLVKSLQQFKTIQNYIINEQKNHTKILFS